MRRKKSFRIAGRDFVLSMRPQSGDEASLIVALVSHDGRKTTYHCDSYQQASETFNTIEDTLNMVRQ